MAVLKIVTYPDPILREKMPDVDAFDDLEDCLQEAYDTLAATVEEGKNGVALAANQIGVRKRFFVLREDLADAAGVPSLILNPRIVRAGKITNTEREGCLSFPDRFIDVVRPRKVDIEFNLLPIQKKTVTLTGRMARIFQHEIDHLDGVLFIDKEQK